MTTTQKIVRAVLLVLLVAGALFLIVHGYEAWRAHVFEEGDTAGAARVQQVLDKQRQTWLTETQRKVDEARADEKRMAAAAAQGEKDARDRAEMQAARDRAAAARSNAAAGRVRNDIASLDAAARAIGVPDAASCPGEFARQRDAAIVARALFGSCVAEYRQLAADGDTAITDLELRLDTALTYIRATGAPGAEQIQLPTSP